MKFILINSASANPFCALYTGDYLAASFSSDFLDISLQGTSRIPDKLINSLNFIEKKYPDDYTKIDAISVITGPGSFTGLRVGIAMAKGISLALDKKIIPITNFELTLNRLGKVVPEKKYCILIPGKKPQYYYALIESKTFSSKEGAINISDFNEFAKINGKFAIVGDFDNETVIKLNYFNILNVRDMKPETDSMLELSIEYFKEGKLFSPDKVEPKYILEFAVKK